MKLLDVVALFQDLPEIGLIRGQVGTIIEMYEPDVFEVEFSDSNGHTYGLETLPAAVLMLLHHQAIVRECYSQNNRSNRSSS
jgi:Domain of unknown function (DUF4926)